MKYDLNYVRERFNSGENLKYIFFWSGKPEYDKSVSKACFSQWWDCKFTADGVEYHTAEQYMMAQKALLFGDKQTYGAIMSASHPHEFQKLGRKVSGFVQEKWDEECCQIVIEGNIAKFSQNEDLKAFLLGTGNRILAEASPIDKIWGIGMAERDNGVYNPFLWQGTNFLGFALMEVRDILLSRQFPEKTDGT